MTTQYIVAERTYIKADGRYPASRSTCYLGWIHLESGVWGWAKGRAEAKRFTSKAEAMKAADCWEAAIRSKGYTPHKICVLPANGGMACNRQSVKL